jgi:ribosomal protein S18 acetylase RimI-like enzyme
VEYVIDDLKADELDDLWWSGGPLHLENVAQQLERRDRGEIEYVVARDESGEPVAKGGVDFGQHEGAGYIWQMATREDMQSRGIGAAIVAELEGRIAARGLKQSVIGVELVNPRAEALYRRLGYQDWSTAEDSWDQMDENGNVYRYETTLLLLRKEL